jgi:hypothetical protein
MYKTGIISELRVNTLLQGHHAYAVESIPKESMLIERESKRSLNQYIDHGSVAT